MKALIIEDEVLAARHLVQILKNIGNIDVTATLETITETIEWFDRNNHPDIIFMDIHLADGNAFEIFNHVKTNSPVIFTTAYDEYALKAFKVNSIDYLLKPVEEADVRESLEKMKRLSSNGFSQNALTALMEYLKMEKRYKTHFLIPTKGDKLSPLSVSEIAYLYIEAGILSAFTFDKKIFRLESTLDEMENSIDPHFFFRANRQYIISRAAIKDIDLWFNSKLSVNLKTESPGKIIISKAKAAEFKKWFFGKFEIQ